MKPIKAWAVRCIPFDTLWDTTFPTEQRASKEAAERENDRLKERVASLELQIEIASRCVRCGAPYRSDGRCRNFTQCQGGVGEAHASDSLRQRIAQLESEVAREKYAHDAIAESWTDANRHHNEEMNRMSERIAEAQKFRDGAIKFSTHIADLESKLALANGAFLALQAAQPDFDYRDRITQLEVSLAIAEEALRLVGNFMERIERAHSQTIHENWRCEAGRFRAAIEKLKASE